MANLPDGRVEEVTQDGWRIVRDAMQCATLMGYYMHYNFSCFAGELPDTPVFWAESITLPDGKSHANALYVSDESLGRPYIVLDKKLESMMPLDRLCLLHEMVHVSLGPAVSGHGERFIAEFKRVLDANRWEVIGGSDSLDAKP
jgi:hypothetical protein